MKQRLLHIAIAIDQLIYVLVTLGAGHPDETLSAAAWRTEQKGRWLGRIFRPLIDRNLRGKPRGSARGSSEQAGTACGATSVASGQLACEVQQGQPHQPLPTAMLSGE